MASDKSTSRENSTYHWALLEAFDLTATMDMSAQWKGLLKGGACKQSNFFAIA
jgi:hypothetical protein